MYALRLACFVGFDRESARDFPEQGIIQYLSQVTVECGGGTAQAHVADEFFPDQLVDVFIGLDVKAGALPCGGNPLEPVGDAPVHFTQTNEFHAVVMDASGLGYRGTKTPGDAEQDIGTIETALDPLSCAEAVLDRQDQGIIPKSTLQAACDGCDTRCLGRNHHEFAVMGVGNIGGGIYAVDRPLATDT